MKERTIVFDIETEGLPEAEIAEVMPEFKAPANYTDPKKIAAAVDEKKKAWLDGRALDPLTARVLVISVSIDDQFILIEPPATEAEILHEFWDMISNGSQIHRLIGFNVLKFDLPFLVTRSWKLNVEVPFGLFTGNRRYPFSLAVEDLMERWQLGVREDTDSLDRIAAFLGIGRKTGSGKDFAALWHSDQAKAIEYCKNDIALTVAAARKMRMLV